jgi:carbonic anhydrase/acetyltransferase-like protein (isoleucine patch superfamily)
MKSFKNKYPEAKGSFIASSATVLGQVKIGINSSVWYGTILRGYFK